MEVTQNHLTVTTKAGTKHQFGGRSSSELVRFCVALFNSVKESWKEAILKSQKQKTTSSLWSKWQKHHNPSKGADSPKGADGSGKEDSLILPSSEGKLRPNGLFDLFFSSVRAPEGKTQQANLHFGKTHF